MIPLPLIVVEVILGLGAALFAANLWVLLRPFVARMRSGPPPPEPYSRTRVVVNMVIGLAIGVWALATLLVRF